MSFVHLYQIVYQHTYHLVSHFHPFTTCHDVYGHVNNTCSALYKTPHTPLITPRSPLITLHSHLPHLRNNYACTPPNPARPSNCCNTRISPANCLTRRSLHALPTSRDPRETCDTLPRAHCTRNIDPSSCSHLCTGPTRRNALASVTYVGPSLGMPPLCSFTLSTSAKSNASTPRTTQTR